LGIEVDEELSPTLIEKISDLGATLKSFEQAQRAAQVLLEIPFSTKRIERLTERIGGVRVRERERAIDGWEHSPLVEKLAAPRGVKTPAVVAIRCD